MNVTVYGPNLPRALADKGTLHVHRTGCAHTARAPFTRLRPGDQGGWSIEATTVNEVVFDIYPPDNFDYDPDNEAEVAPYVNDIYFAPCTKELT